MGDTFLNLNQRIAAQVATLRATRRLSLAALSSKSGVSRSMISLIERGECSPTAVVLEKLATGLGVTLASLFDGSAETGSPSPIARRSEQFAWQDPASGYVRRNISPPGTKQPMQIVEVRFPAGGRVAFETGSREPLVHQQVWLLAGSLDITVGQDCHHLRAGDCLAMQLDQPIMFHNPTSRPVHYVVVLSTVSFAR